MNDQADLRTTVQQMVETAATDPDAVRVEEIFDVAEEADREDQYRLARALDHKVAADPSAADEAIGRVESLVRSGATEDQRFVMIVVEQTAGRDPERATPAIDVLADGIRSEDPFVRRHAVWALAHLSDHDPALVAPLVADLDPDGSQSPYFEHEHVILVLRNVAREDLTATVPMLHSLFDLLEDADAFVGAEKPDEQPQNGDTLLWLDRFKEGVEPGMTAAGLLVELSDAAPEAVADHVEDATAVLESVDRVTVRRGVVEALATLATDDPAAVEPAIPALAAQLDTGDEVLQARAARALGLAFDAAPADVADAVEGSLPELEPVLRDGTPAARSAVAGLLAAVAETEPARVEPFSDALVACLDPEQGYAAASAAIALGYVGDADARAALERLASADLDPEVRDPVERAIEQVDARVDDR